MYCHYGTSAYLTSAITLFFVIFAIATGLGGLRRGAAEETAACRDPGALEAMLRDRWTLTGGTPLVRAAGAWLPHRRGNSM